jgi:hypothetical protein
MGVSLSLLGAHSSYKTNVALFRTLQKVIVNQISLKGEAYLLLGQDVEEDERDSLSTSKPYPTQRPRHGGPRRPSTPPIPDSLNR